jgi:hypothetical protein
MSNTNNVVKFELIATTDPSDKPETEIRSSSSSSSDDTPPTKKAKGRPRGSGLGKYTFNPNQRVGGNKGKKYAVKPRVKTPEEIAANRERRRKIELAHYYRIREDLINARRAVKVRRLTMTQIISEHNDQFRELLNIFSDEDLNAILAGTDSLKLSIEKVRND